MRWAIKHKSGRTLFVTSDEFIANNRGKMGWIVEEVMSKCQRCNNTGMADGGGVKPWGEQILIECDCIIEEAMTDMRKQFESWLEDVHGLYGEDVEWEPERNCYAKFGIHLAWCAWQASRAAIEVSTPWLCGDGDNDNEWTQGYNDGVMATEKAIISAGLKVKK